VLSHAFTKLIPLVRLWQRWGAVLLLAAIGCVGGRGRAGFAIDAFEEPPISYSDTEPVNAVSKLQTRLMAGDEVWDFERSTGYLPSLLESLEIPVSSQTLVFSKTSLQQRLITPKNPRAIYFNDDVYVGYVRGGDVLEVSVADPQLGTVFYTLDQDANQPPRFVRQTESCLLCHGGSQTKGVPGHIVRSVYAARSGQPIFSAGSYRVDDATPLAERWGGWYVTGRHGDASHLGNVTYTHRPEPGEELDTTGLNQLGLRARFDAEGYLSADSDLVALTVLAHQASVHTQLAKVGIDVRTALHREAMLNRELGEPEGHRWPSTESIINSSAEALVKVFLFEGAAPLPAAISGTTSFADEFAAKGPWDAEGRTLRTLDLNTRLLRYPCSFLIYSKSFAALPEELRQRFWEKMDRVLCGDDTEKAFSHLAATDRRAIREILAATTRDAPRHWAEP
jgi:hypothetical protein